jgi:hypothetical protein
LLLPRTFQSILFVAADADAAATDGCRQQRQSHQQTDARRLPVFRFNTAVGVSTPRATSSAKLGDVMVSHAMGASFA